MHERYSIEKETECGVLESKVSGFPQRTYRSRREIAAFSAGAYITTLYVMVDIIKRGGHASPTFTSLG
jgi:hypothetical protein